MKRSLSIHARLFLGFASALAVCAALMVAIIYVGMRFLPTYGFSDTVVVDPSDVTDVVPGMRLPASGEHADISSAQDVWSTVLAVSVGGVLIVGALGLGAGWFISKRLLAPLHTINEAARKAADGNLGDRLDATGPKDELKDLSDTFDEMLDRLEASFASHQRFAANASHELLTPLATTRAALQVAGDEPSREELAELLPMLRETNERGIRIVHALLDLASAENAAFDPEPVDLSALVRTVVAERTAEASSYAIKISTDIAPNCTTAGNAVLLRQLLGNLLDNALTHNGPEGSVDVRLRRVDAAVVLEVANTGPQVDEAQLSRLFEPFYRAKSRVAGDRTGHGLGLAIVRAVTTAHHGTLDAKANPAGGLGIRVELPH